MTASQLVRAPPSPDYHHDDHNHGDHDNHGDDDHHGDDDNNGDEDDHGDDKTKVIMTTMKMMTTIVIRDGVNDGNHYEDDIADDGHLQK